MEMAGRKGEGGRDEGRQRKGESDGRKGEGVEEKGEGKGRYRLVE